MSIDSVSAKHSYRIHGYDVIRGLSVISMVGFHLCYDLVYLYGTGPSWFAPPLQDVWRSSISWVFLLIAGIMATYSRSNLKRACRYLAVAFAIFVATSVASVDTPINYGIIYCMGFSTLIAWVVQKVTPKELTVLGRVMAAAICAMAFLLCLGIPTGTFGLKQFGGPYVRVSPVPYASGLLSWLGFPGPRFASGDYYPPIPFTLLYLSGYFLGGIIQKSGHATEALSRLRCKPLEFVGRHALEVYMVHQPLILLVLTFAFGR